MSELNFAGGSIWTGDNLPILRGMNSACVDLIYLDPPFNSNRNYEAPIGSKAAGAAFKDAWTLDDVDVHEHGELAERHPAAAAVVSAARHAYGEDMTAYLLFMSVRLLEMHRVLRETGSIYLHCDPTAGHYLKLLLDAIFGRENFRNEIIWIYGLGGSSKRAFSRKHDVLLFYGRSGRHRFVKPRQASTSRRMAGREKGMTDSWSDIPSLNNMARERVGYPTQKPLALLERIVSASSSPGDMVLDPFCGCGTALVAASRLHRRWAGIDLSPVAVRLAEERVLAASRMPSA